VRECGWGWEVAILDLGLGLVTAPVPVPVQVHVQVQIYCFIIISCGREKVITSSGRICEVNDADVDFAPFAFVGIAVEVGMGYGFEILVGGLVICACAAVRGYGGGGVAGAASGNGGKRGCRGRRRRTNGHGDRNVVVLVSAPAFVLARWALSLRGKARLGCTLFLRVSICGMSTTLVN